MTLEVLLGIIKVVTIKRKGLAMSDITSSNPISSQSPAKVVSSTNTDSQAPLTKVWIAGASGFCGRALTRYLANSPHYHPLPHIRPQSSRLDLLKNEWSDLGVEAIICDWIDLEQSFQEQQPQVIISCIGTTKSQAKRGGGGYQEIDEGLNIRLIKWAESLNTPPYFVYISSMGAQWGKWNAYLRARMNVEKALENSTLYHTIIRPALLSGDSRDESRIMESFGSTFSHGLARFYQALGLTHRAHKVRPLDAPEMANFIGYILDIRGQQSIHKETLSRQSLYSVDQIHKIIQDEL